MMMNQSSSPQAEDGNTNIAQIQNTIMIHDAKIMLKYSFNSTRCNTKPITDDKKTDYLNENPSNVKCHTGIFFYCKLYNIFTSKNCKSNRVYCVSTLNVVRFITVLLQVSRSCWCAQAGHQMSLSVEHMACCLFGAMCSHVDCLSPPILLLNHCFSGSSCVSLVTLVCLPI